MTRALVRLALVGACAMALAGCISLLPKSKPAQLYRFGPPPAAATVAPRGAAVTVLRANGSFQGESADDRILTIEGGKAAYIAESRWVSPAEVLFNEAVADAFDASRVRLLSRGQLGRAAYALRLDVRNFEARYEQGPKATPMIVVRVHAALIRTDQPRSDQSGSGQSGISEQDFEARVPATDNRVSAIVAAYDRAVGDVLGKLVAWTETKAV